LKQIAEKPEEVLIKEHITEKILAERLILGLEEL